LQKKFIGKVLQTSLDLVLHTNFYKKISFSFSGIINNLKGARKLTYVSAQPFW